MLAVMINMVYYLAPLGDVFRRMKSRDFTDMVLKLKINVNDENKMEVVLFDCKFFC